MVQIKDITRYLENWAPPAYAEDYDNPGLLVGDADAVVSGVMVSLDCTEDVVEDAINRNCNLIVSHHPILFKGIKSLTGKNYVERTLLKAIRNDIALYAIHTNLDSVMTGVNAKIAEKLGLKNISILAPKKELLMKLTFFVPQENAESVRAEIFRAGAGVIGNYSDCSFNLEGKGTFTPENGATPTKGEVNRPHEEAETRVEVMFPSHLKRSVIRTLKSAHPYEEVAYYLHDLQNENQYVGSGMVGDLEKEINLEAFLNYLKERMELKMVRYTLSGKDKISRVALCGGSGSFLLPQAKASGADAFITGDFKYHEFFDAENTLVIADIGHYESERFTMDLIAEKIRGKFSTFATRLTQANTNPIHYI